MTDDIDFGASDVPPYIKFNAKGNVWAVNHGAEDETINPPRMLIDLEHMQKGWLRFREQLAPPVGTMVARLERLLILCDGD